MRLPTDADVEVYREVYERDCYGVRDRIGAFDLVVDIGANVGCFSRLALDCGAKRVVGVEVVPAWHALLTENCADSRFSGVLGYAGVNGTGCHFARDVPWVDVATLLRGVDGRVLLKIDIEGYEYDLLSELGAAGVLGVPELVLGEFHQPAGEWSGRIRSVGDVVRFLGGFGRPFSLPMTYAEWPRLVGNFEIGSGVTPYVLRPGDDLVAFSYAAIEALRDRVRGLRSGARVLEVVGGCRPVARQLAHALPEDGRLALEVGADAEACGAVVDGLRGLSCVDFEVSGVFDLVVLGATADVNTWRSFVAPGGVLVLHGDAAEPAGAKLMSDLWWVE